MKIGNLKLNDESEQLCVSAPNISNAMNVEIPKKFGHHSIGDKSRHRYALGASPRPHYVRDVQ